MPNDRVATRPDVIHRPDRLHGGAGHQMRAGFVHASQGDLPEVDHTLSARAKLEIQQICDGVKTDVFGMPRGIL